MEESGFETFLKGFLAVVGLVAFIGAILWFALSQEKKRFSVLEKKYPLFMVKFRKGTSVSHELTAPLYDYRDGKSFSYLYLILNIVVLALIFLFVNEAWVFKVIMVLLSVGLFYIARSRANRYLKLYENAIVIGNRHKAKTFWFDEIDAIEAKFTNPGTPENKLPYALQAYMIIQNGKSVSGFYEDVFPGAGEVLEAYFSSEQRPFVEEVRQSIFKMHTPSTQQ